MCGIAAVLASPGRISPESLERATLSLRHRGPDAQRQWIAPHGRVGLGHSRLSIIDLSTGDQPIGSEDERCQVVVNGEFYDFEAIRTQLEGQGHTFRTRSDSEIALHLYEEYGTRCLNWLRGEFAFALWDERNQTLFAARDRFGIKPLYYAQHDGALYLASEIKALFAMGVPARWNPETLYLALMGMSHEQDASHFAGVYQVPPGHYLLARDGHLRVLPYWDFDYPPAAQLAALRPEESIEALRDVLHQAVKLRLRADVPVACYLSGGLDSCAVLGVASLYSSRPLRAYTLSFDHADYDERAIAQEQAARSGAEFTPIEIRSAHLAEHFEEALYHAERPFVNAHCVAKYLLSRAVRDDGTRVVLTGEGADEIFAGYPHFRRDLVLYNAEGQSPQDIRLLLEELGGSNRVSQGILLPEGETGLLPDVKKALGYVPSFLELWAQIGGVMGGLLHPDFAANCREYDPFCILLNQMDLQRQLTGRDAVNQSLYLWAKTALPNYILSNLGDRMEMAHSVEGRLPFLDHHLVERVATMPVAMKIQGMTEKYALREAARPVLTDTVYRRQKHPFLSPPSALQTEGDLYQLVQDTLRGSALAGMGVFEPTRVVALLEALPTLDTASQTRLDPILTLLTSLCLLHRRFDL